MHQKYLKYIYLPDFANKFLISNLYNVSPKDSTVYFKYIFSSYTTYNPTAIKALMIIESIYPIKSKSISTIISLKFTKPRCHSIIYIGINLPSFYEFFPLYVKKPVTVQSVLNSYQKSSKYFIFPGFTSHLIFPSWKRTLVLSFNVPKDRLLFFFQKSAFLD